MPPSLDDNATPNWETTSDEIHCPLCSYNLRGLSEPRCPECGYRFSWSELTDPKRKDHPYLFEHHARRWFWSFWKTARGGLRPFRFWRGLNPRQTSRPELLLIYSAIAFVLGVLALLPVIWRENIRTNGPDFEYYKNGAYYVVLRELSVNDYLSALSGTWQNATFQWTAATLLYWPIATFLTLQVFRQSMGRARVKSVHVLRCVLYSSDAVLVAMPLACIAYFLFVYGLRAGDVDEVLMCGVAMAVSWMAFRIFVAYKLYLRFDHPFLTILATQLIVALLALAVALQMNVGKPIW